ncbi:MAG TPA: bifunctional shikimate kinase/3-dehydroquinate synthase [Solirubrobacteraceae bacterium]|jgi:shikimate kinase/3-dehydroquinate synthase|nr:bifunctional shikimate kinase/3-dehydroquinate synthase [Solirubrobacteraceae bacterium]
MSVVLIGFMGAGKTSAGRMLAEAAGVEAVDTDALVEHAAGQSVPELFEGRGEAAFRALEEQVVSEALRRAGPNQVLSLGGGSLHSARVREALAGHRVVLLDVDLETAWTRAHDRGRPLARDRDEFERRYAERAELYGALAHAVVPGRAALTRAFSHVRALPDGVRLLWASASSGEYPVWVGTGILGRLPWPLDGRRFCVSDATVEPAYGALIEPRAGSLRLPPGEAHKTLSGAEQAWRWLAGEGATRADHVVALGGGVVGDLAGFCAATYQRGIPVVQVPSTVVAQVDSAYGGKTGVDLPEGKNYVGAYHQPAAVIADTALLASLPAEEVAAGWAEVVKTALIAGGPLWERVRAGEGRRAAVDPQVIFACARTKLAVVAADERDGGRRQVLNLGHTIGHAIETVTGYRRYRHGEAVALGLLAALTLSEQPALRAEVAALLAGAGLPVRLDAAVDPDAVQAATIRDKKRTGTEVPFVLARAPGDVVHGQLLPASAVAAAIRGLGDAP